MLCANPQLATIVCFLHADNPSRVLLTRARILEECALALLRRDDDQRETLLDSVYRAKLLASLAWVFLRDSQASMSELDVLTLFRSELAVLGRPAGIEAKVLAELVQHSGLLLRSNTRSIHFAHQAFVEYFAAEHLSQLAGGAASMLELWRRDPTGIAETIVIYGAIKQLADEAILSAAAESSPALALRLIAVCRVSDRAMLERVAQHSVAELLGSPSRDLVDAAGQFLLANGTTGLGERIESALVELCARPATDANAWVREEALRILLALRPQDAASLLEPSIDTIDLAAVLPFVGKATLQAVHDGLSTRMADPGFVLRWIAALRDAQLPAELGATFAMLRDPLHLQACAVALTTLSHLEETWSVIESLPTEHLKNQPSIEAAWARWQWCRERPTSAAGRRAATALCRYLASEIQGKGQLPFVRLGPDEAHRWIYYVAHAMAWEDFYERKTDRPLAGVVRNVPGMICQSTPRLLHAVWERGDDEPGVDPDKPLLQLARTLLGVCPLLLGFALAGRLYEGVTGAPLPTDALLISGLLGVLTIAAWGRVAFHRGAYRTDLSALDVAISTVLGPSAVLAELRYSVGRKRRDDRFAAPFAVTLATVYAGAAWLLPGVGVAAVALGACADALWSSNRTAGWIDLLNRQGYALQQFVRGSSTNAVQ